MGVYAGDQLPNVTAFHNTHMADAANTATGKHMKTFSSILFAKFYVHQ
jgi:hypothetical protein